MREIYSPPHPHKEITIPNDLSHPQIHQHFDTVVHSPSTTLRFPPSFSPPPPHRQHSLSATPCAAGTHVSGQDGQRTDAEGGRSGGILLRREGGVYGLLAFRVFGGLSGLEGADIWIFQGEI